MHFVVRCFETAERAGAGRTFRIATQQLRRLDGNSADVSMLVDQGKHFQSASALKFREKRDTSSLMRKMR